MPEERKTIIEQAKATTTTEGILSEKKLTITPNEEGINVLSGSFTLQTGEINFTEYRVFAAEFTPSGKKNPSYASLVTLLNEHSIPEVGADEASCIAVNSGQLNPSTFYRNGQEFHGLGYRASFINRINRESFEPCNTFMIDKCYIERIEEETDKETQTPTGRVLLHCLLPTYNGIEPFIVAAPQEYAAALNYHFSDPDSCTARISGVIVSTTEIITTKQEMAIGEDVVNTREKHVNELLLKGANPLGETEQISFELIQRAKAEYALVLEEKKRKSLNSDNGNNARKANTGSGIPTPSASTMGAATTNGRKFTW